MLIAWLYYRLYSMEIIVGLQFLHDRGIMYRYIYTDVGE